MKITAAQFREMNKKKSKYRNKKVEVDGTKYDSKKEAKVFTQLQLMEKCGKIFDLKRQVSFELLPAQYRVVNGKKKCIERACKYIADFTYNDENMNLVIVDAKGFRTPDYKIKKKLMLSVHNIIIKEI